MLESFRQFQEQTPDLCQPPGYKLHTEDNKREDVDAPQCGQETEMAYDEWVRSLRSNSASTVYTQSNYIAQGEAAIQHFYAIYKTMRLYQ